MPEKFINVNRALPTNKCPQIKSMAHIFLNCLRKLCKRSLYQMQEQLLSP